MVKHNHKRDIDKEVSTGKYILKIQQNFFSLIDKVDEEKTEYPVYRKFIVQILLLFDELIIISNLK